MSSKHPEDWKSEGNAANAAGDLETAIACYTAALEAVSPDGVKNSHIYLNNRALVHLKKQDFKAAVDDATAAINENRDFVKAYRTKASALRSLNRNQEAVTTLEEALAKDGSDVSTQQALADARRALASPTPSTPRTASAAPARSPAPAGAGSSSPLTTFVLGGRVAQVAALVCYLLPLGGLSLQAWTALVLSSFLTHAALVVSTVGKPQMNAEYVQRVLLCPWASLLLTPVAAYMSGPTFLLAIAMALISALAIGEKAYSTLPPARPILSAIAARGLPLLTGVPAAQIASWSVSRKWEEANTAALRTVALLEVMNAIALLVRLPLGSAGIVAVLISWQMQQVVYPISTPHQQAWAQVDGQIRAWLAAPVIPAPVRSGYDKFSTFLRGRVKTIAEMQADAEAEQRAGGAGGGAAGGAGGASGGLAGLAQKCTIS